MKRKPTINFIAKPYPNSELALVYAIISFGYNEHIIKSVIDKDHFRTNNVPSETGGGFVIYVDDEKKDDNVVWFGENTKWKSKTVTGLKPVPVYLSTGISLLKSTWDPKIKRSKDESINKKLDKLESTINDVYESLLISGEKITPALLKSAIEKWLIKSKDPQANFAEAIIEEVSRAVAKAEFVSPLFAEYTLAEIETDYQLKIIGDHARKHYKGFQKRFTKFCTDNARTIYCHELSDDLLKDYFVWLRKTFVYDEGSVDLDKKVFKKYAGRAKKKYSKHFIEEFHVSRNPFLAKKGSAEKPIVFLTLDELKRIENLTSKQLQDLAPELAKDKKQIELVRDYFLLTAWNGGNRYGDYYKSGADNGYELTPRPGKPGKFYLENISLKTLTYTKLPAFPITVNIWQKYKGKIPAPPKNSPFNKIMQKICHLAGINSMVLQDKSESMVEKWNLITSHVAKKSFVNLMYYEFKQPLKSIQVWVGEKSLRVLEKHYLGLLEVREKFDELDQLIDDLKATGKI